MQDSDASDVECREIPARVWTIPNALDAAVCADYVSRGLDGAWQPSGARQGAEPTRTIQKILIDTDSLFDAVRRHLPDVCGGLAISRVPRERVLLLRYSPGDRFMLHKDAPYIPDDQSRSLLSLIVYLNEGYVGGETRFPDEDVVVRPRTGMALAFPHHIRHEGLGIVSGEKYALHTFVMYRRH